MLHTRPLKTTTAALALALALALATAAPAGARPIDLNSANPGSSFVGSTSDSAAPTIVHVTAPSGGFDWGDAGIGAAGGLALSILGVGSALAVSGHRTRRQTIRQA